MKPTTGFDMLSRIQAAARFSAWPPISPIMMTPSVPGSASNCCRQSMKSVPFTGSPPMPTAVDWPSPRVVSCCTAS
jgi:hypothetical protein